MRKSWFLLVVVLVLSLAVVPVFAQEQTLPEALVNDADGRFTTLLAAVEAAGLEEALSGEGPFTLLAPTNDAFEAAFDFLGISADDLLADTEMLTEILTYHVLPGEYFFRELVTDPALESLQGETVQFSLEAGSLTANGVLLGDVDNVTSNGLFHTLEDGVLLPAALQEAAQANRAHIRVAHLSPDAGPVDIFIGGDLTDLVGVEFGTVSEWLDVAAGAYSIGVAATGDEPSGSVLGRVEAGAWVTIAAVGIAATDDLQVRFLAEDHSPIPDGQARLHVFHAIQNAPSIDVLADGSPLIVNLAYPNTLGDNDGLDIRTVPALSYALSVVFSGTTEPVVLTDNFGFQSGYNYFIAAAGTPQIPSFVVASTAPADAAVEEES